MGSAELALPAIRSVHFGEGEDQEGDDDQAKGNANGQEHHSWSYCFSWQSGTGLDDRASALIQLLDLDALGDDDGLVEGFLARCGAGAPDSNRISS
jgi:hypothetical protein